MLCLRLWELNEMELNHETIIYILVFIVPGYIITSMQDIISPSKQFPEYERMIHAVGYSVLNLCTIIDVCVHMS